jgi:hypothetical protein
VYSFGITIDGAGSVITTGVKGGANPTIPFTGTIVGWTLVADQVGSIEIDILKASGALPTSGNSICGTGTKPTISSNTYATGSDFTNWSTTAITVGDVVGFNVISSTNVTRATLTVRCTVP